MPQSPEAKSDPPSFAQKLGGVLTDWANAHPDGDKPIMQFIGESPDGKMGVSRAMTPKEYAQHVTDQTAFGERRTKFYLDVSNRLEDPTGERVLADFRKMTEEYQKRKANKEC